MDTDDAVGSSPEGTTLRIAAAMLSFAVMGLLVSTVGLMLPSLERHYHLDDAHVSAIFVVAPLGYLIATLLTRRAHASLGRRGIAVVGPALQLVSALGAGSHPASYGVFLALLGVGSLGVGLLDGAWCAWAGGMANANTVSGLLHGSFSAGAGLGPLLGGLLMTAGGREWFVWYYVLAGITVLEAVILAVAFRHDNAERYHAEQSHQRLNSTSPPPGAENDILGTPAAAAAAITTEDDDATTGATPLLKSAPPPSQPPSPSARAIISHPVTWICAAFLLVEVGTESAVSGWIVLYLLRARHTAPALAAAGSSAFWIGQTVGRLTLGPVTDRYGLRRAVTVYLLAVVASSTAFALLSLGPGSEGARVSSVGLVALMGVFCGPLFPSAIVQLTSALPREMHVGAVTYVAMIGQVGGALLPVGIGLLIQGLGIGVFPVVVVVQVVLGLGLWLLFPITERGNVKGAAGGRE